jgi:hypothetical protein
MKEKRKASELAHMVWEKLGSDAHVSVEVYSAPLGWTVQVVDRGLRGSEYQLKALAIAENLQKLYDLEE